MQLRRLLIVTAAALSVAGCGSGTSSVQKSSVPRRVADLARKCGESESDVEANVNVFLRVANAHGLHGSSAEAADALDKVATYAEGHKESPDCKGLLAALISVGRNPPTRRICFPYRTGRVCFAPPSKN